MAARRVIRGSDGFGDFVGCFRDDLICFLALNSAIASHADHEGRHSVRSLSMNA